MSSCSDRMKTAYCVWYSCSQWVLFKAANWITNSETFQRLGLKSDFSLPTVTWEWLLDWRSDLKQAIVYKWLFFWIQNPFSCTAILIPRKKITTCEETSRFHSIRHSHFKIQIEKSRLYNQVGPPTQALIAPYQKKKEKKMVTTDRKDWKQSSICVTKFSHFLIPAANTVNQKAISQDQWLIESSNEATMGGSAGPAGNLQKLPPSTAICCFSRGAAIH